MQLQKTNGIQFRASLVRPVKLIGKNGKSYNANFIKFNTGSAKDVKSLEAIKVLWGGKNLSAGIAEEAKILGKEAQIYGLTLQSQGFKNIDSSQVLGLVSTDNIQKGKDTEIFKIGTNPKYAYEQKKSKRTIRHIARNMLESIKRLNGNKALLVNNPEQGDMKFLKKMEIEPGLK